MWDAGHELMDAAAAVHGVLNGIPAGGGAAAPCRRVLILFGLCGAGQCVCVDGVDRA